MEEGVNTYNSDPKQTDNNFEANSVTVMRTT